MNIVMITGRLTEKPELRKTPNDKKVTSFCIADNKDAEHVSFIDCVAWERTAEFICKYFSKGGWISCAGVLQSRTYKDKEGKTRKVLEILVDKAAFCGDKMKDENRAPAEYEPITGDDDLPF